MKEKKYTEEFRRDSDKAHVAGLVGHRHCADRSPKAAWRRGDAQKYGKALAVLR